MNDLENMTIEEAHSLLVMRSNIVEELIKLERHTKGEIFIMGTSRFREIFLTEEAFMKFAALFGKEIIHDCDNEFLDDDGNTWHEAHFFYTLHEREYKIYCLPD